MNTKFPATSKTPEIGIDKQNSIISISGVLIPENPIQYFESLTPLIYEAYDLNNTLTLKFYLEYFNTGAAKYLYRLFLNLKEKQNIKIIWIYDEDDEDILESGQEFAELTGLEFEFKAISI